jgi:adenylylsulfate kinase-like enzyme
MTQQAPATPGRLVLLPDPVIEAYKIDVDRTLLRENLKLTVEQRLKQHRKMAEMAAALRKAGRK